MKENGAEKITVVQIHEQDGKGKSSVVDAIWFSNPRVLEAMCNGLYELIFSLEDEDLKLDETDKKLLKEAKIVYGKLKRDLSKIYPEDFPPSRD